jgi:hypothetical protein
LHLFDAEARVVPHFEKTLVLLAWQEEQARAMGKEEELLYILTARPIQ